MGRCRRFEGGGEPAELVTFGTDSAARRILPTVWSCAYLFAQSYIFVQSATMGLGMADGAGLGANVKIFLAFNRVAGRKG